MNGGFYDKQRRGGLTSSGMILLCAMLVPPTIALLRLAHKLDPRFLFAYVFLVSIATYLLFRQDKRKAEKGEWRTPEATLHILEFIGGWPAAFIAQRNFRHKTSKASYQIAFWAIILFHEALSIDYLSDWKIATQLLAFTKY